MKMNKRGVTLIEVVIVFAIIAIGAVLMVPNMGAWLPNYRLRSATRDITSTLRVAQMRAVSNNSDYRGSLPLGWKLYPRALYIGLIWVAEGDPKLSNRHQVNN